MYVISVYWSLMTLTTVGYGDITPCQDNITEYVVSCCCILIGAATWAYMTGVMCGVVSTFNPGELRVQVALCLCGFFLIIPFSEEITFRAKIDELNSYMREEHFPNELRESARDFFNVSRKLETQKRNTGLFQDVSPKVGLAPSL